MTPGHTTGVLSLFFEVKDGENTYLAGMFEGAGLNTIEYVQLFYNEYPVDYPKQMLDSIEKVWNEPVDIQLGNHPVNNRTFIKREKQLAQGGNPFIVPEDWQNFLSELKKKVEKLIEDNKKMEKKLDDFFGV